MVLHVKKMLIFTIPRLVITEITYNTALENRDIKIPNQ